VDSFLIASFLKPLAALLVIMLFAAPVKRLVQRRLKPGRLKRLLLWELDPEKARSSTRQQTLGGRAK
jgi:hypothetical protein